MAGAPVPIPLTLKALAELVECRVVASVLVKDQESTRKEIRKYFGEWKDLGLLSKEPEAPAPDGPALGKIINLVKSHHRVAAAEYISAGSPTWGLKKAKWDKAQNKHLIVTAMTNVMKKNFPNATNPQVTTNQAHSSSIPSAPPPPTTDRYPVILNPPQHDDTCCSSKPPLQAPLFHITSGQVNLEGEAMDAAIKEYQELKERVACLDDRVSDLQREADTETDSENHSGQEGRPTSPLLMDLNLPVASSTPHLPVASSTPLHLPVASSTPLEHPPRVLRIGPHGDNRQDHSSTSGGPDLPHALPTTHYPPPSRITSPPKRDAAIPPQDEDNGRTTTTTGVWSKGQFIGLIEGDLYPGEDNMPSRAAERSSPPASRTRARNLLDCQQPAPGNPIFQGPLRVGPTGQALFLPYTMKDLTSLVNNLPPLAKGADNWIRNLVTLTAGDPLCLGDYRGLLTRQGGAHVCNKIMTAAGLTDSPDRSPLTTCAGLLHDTMRALYPIQLDPRALGSITLKEGEDLNTYTDRASKLWMEAMGTRHDVSETTLILCRHHPYSLAPPGGEWAS